MSARGQTAPRVGGRLSGLAGARAVVRRLRLRGPRTVRWRLTLLYSSLFVVAGALLLAFTYLLYAHNGAGQAATTFEGPRLVSGVPGSDATPTVTAVVAAVRADQRHQLLVEACAALAVMALASLALGWLMAGRVLSPLRTMTASARRISADNLHERLAVPGPDDELKAVADTFDAVLARLEGAFEAQKQFVANASHELPAPRSRSSRRSWTSLSPTRTHRRRCCASRWPGCGRPGQEQGAADRRAVDPRRAANAALRHGSSWILRRSWRSGCEAWSCPCGPGSNPLPSSVIRSSSSGWSSTSPTTPYGTTSRRGRGVG
ncbi:HAMP domain-containing protein [Streptomyces sp. L7]